MLFFVFHNLIHIHKIIMNLVHQFCLVAKLHYLISLSLTPMSAAINNAQFLIQASPPTHPVVLYILLPLSPPQNVELRHVFNLVHLIAGIHLQ